MIRRGFPPLRTGWLVMTAMIAAALAGTTALATSPRPEEFAARDRWAALHLGGPEAAPPFSFRYAGKTSAELLRVWKREATTREIDASRIATTTTWTDPTTGLVVRCVSVAYRDFPVVEWTAWFENTGRADTPLLEDVQGLDVSWKGGQGQAVLHHARGSVCTAGDYEPFATPLKPGEARRFGGSAGRPSGDHWPYFNLERGGEGLIVVVGWPAQWAGTFRAGDDGAVGIHAGQEILRATLHPGESIRSPLMALLFWKGDVERSQNLWRRWMIAHGMTRPNGSPPPPQFVGCSSRSYGEMVHADEASQIMFIDRYLEEGIGLNAWWMDAGWYVQRSGWPQTGTWEVDRARFPRGLRAITDHAHSRGLRTIVWFEPERVAPGTWLSEQHPEWLLPRSSVEGAAPLGLRTWSSGSLGTDPCVSANLSKDPRGLAGFTVPGRGMVEHPGPNGEYGVVRWTAPEAGEVTVRARFSKADPQATTDVQVLVAGHPLLDDRIGEKGREPAVEKTVTVAKGDAIDLVVGDGGNGHVCDSTFLNASIAGHEPVAEYGVRSNPAGAWSYGWLKPGPTPQSETFTAFDRMSLPGENQSRLLDLGIPEARRWLTDHVDRLLGEQGIDVYRQDFNIDPLGFWRSADAPDRQGITENHHVVGYLAYWDELIRRHPGLLIDSCASGGRRNDLETMRRAVPLWRTDYAYQAIGDQCITYGLSPWLPYFGSGTTGDLDAAYMGAGPSKVNPYAFWSNASPSLNCGVDMRERGNDYKALRTLVARWRELSRFYYDDYYPLTPYSQEPTAWLAWQYHSPERGEGAVQAFRRPQAGPETLTVRLRGLDPLARYTLTTRGIPGQREAAGRELADGLEIRLPARPAATVILYKQK